MECTLTRREALKRREISNPKKANDKLRGKREKKHYRSCFFQQSIFMGYIGFRECICLLAQHSDHFVYTMSEYSVV